MMSRFCTLGAYLLLVPQGRVLIQDMALIRDRVLISIVRATENLKIRSFF